MSFYFTDYYDARRWAKTHLKSKYQLVPIELHRFARFAMYWIRGHWGDNATPLNAQEWEYMLVHRVLPITRGD